MPLSGAAYFGGQALNATGIGGNVSESTSTNAGLGAGITSGKSWSEGGGSSYEYGTSNSQSDNFADNFSDEWSRTYGTEASAKDIERAKEANDKAYELWKQQANFNATEAEKQRIWQEKLSNTAYQRTVQDLLKAGLNPYLAATSLGGAATPSGAVASSGLATAHKATTYADQESQGHSQGHSEGHSQSSSYNEGGGSNYSVGGSNNYGINFEINSGKSNSSSMPALGSIISNAVKTATASTSGKGQTIGQWQASVRNSGSGGTAKGFKGFDGSGYDPAY